MLTRNHLGILAILEAGESTVSAIADGVDLTRSGAYRALEGLVHKGLVLKRWDAGRYRYALVDRDSMILVGQGMSVAVHLEAQPSTGYDEPDDPSGCDEPSAHPLVGEALVLDRVFVPDRQRSGRRRRSEQE